MEEQETRTEEVEETEDATEVEESEVEVKPDEEAEPTDNDDQPKPEDTEAPVIDEGLKAVLDAIGDEDVDPKMLEALTPEVIEKTPGMKALGRALRQQVRAEAAAEQADGHVGDQCEVLRLAPDLAIEAADLGGIGRHLGEQADGQVVEQRAKNIRDREPEVVHEGAIEVLEPDLAVVVLDGLDHIVEVGMGTQGALRERDQ